MPCRGVRSTGAAGARGAPGDADEGPNRPGGWRPSEALTRPAPAGGTWATRVGAKAGRAMATGAPCGGVRSCPGPEDGGLKARSGAVLSAMAGGGPTAAPDAGDPVLLEHPATIKVAKATENSATGSVPRRGAPPRFECLENSIWIGTQYPRPPTTIMPLMKLYSC